MGAVPCRARLSSVAFRALHDCVMDGFAKMYVQAHIFASWYNKKASYEIRPY